MPKLPTTLPRAAYIGGEWVDTPQCILVEAPGWAEPLTEIARCQDDHVEVAVQAANDAFLGSGNWRLWSARQRGEWLFEFAARIDADAENLAMLECLDTGKPLSQARADITACARYFRYYAGAADKLHGDTLPFDHGYTVLTWREPHGVCGQIIPWNYPAQIFGRCVAAALAAGNTVVLKPAEDACLSVLRLTQLVAQNPLPPGVFNMIPGYGGEAGAALAMHPGIHHLSFTGSPETGTLVAQAAAVNHVPVTLELGGKSPQVLFADADLDSALAAVERGIIQNAGQTCSAGSRLLVDNTCWDVVLDRLSSRFSGLYCDTGERDADCGPLINARQKAHLEDRLTAARGDGVRVMARGRLAHEAPSNGHFVVPQLLVNLPEEHPMLHEELFGPILTVQGFSDEEDALRLANATDFGLAAGIWTRDGARQLRLARGIRSGQIFINNYGAAGGVELPFGGVGRSGYGREKGFEGLLGYTQTKMVAIRHG